MPHDASKIVLGGVKKSYKEVTNHAGEIAAGLVCHQASDGSISVDSAEGSAIGVSVGRSLSDIPRSAVCREGLGVPLKLEGAFEPAIGAQVYYHDTTGEAVAHDDGDAVATNAIYVSEAMTGVGEDGVEVSVALIDMPGGL
jgi:hypothetical protein